MDIKINKDIAKEYPDDMYKGFHQADLMHRHGNGTGRRDSAAPVLCGRAEHPHSGLRGIPPGCACGPARGSSTIKGCPFSTRSGNGCALRTSR